MTQTRDKRPLFLAHPHLDASDDHNLKRHQHSHSAGNNLFTSSDGSSSRPRLLPRHSSSSSLSSMLPSKSSKSKVSFDEAAGYQNDGPYQIRSHARASRLFSSFGFRKQDKYAEQQPGLASPASSSMESTSPPPTPYSHPNSSTPCFVAGPSDSYEEVLEDDRAYENRDYSKPIPRSDALSSPDQPTSRWRRSFFSPFGSSAKTSTKSSHARPSLKKSNSTLSLNLPEAFQSRASVSSEPPVLQISNPTPLGFEFSTEELASPQDQRPTSMLSVASQTSTTSSLLRDPPSSAQILTVQAVHKFGQSSPVKANLSSLVTDETEQKHPRQQGPHHVTSALDINKNSDSRRIQAPDTAVSLSAHMHDRQRKLSKSASKTSLPSSRARANSMKRDQTRSQSNLSHKKTLNETSCPVPSLPTPSSSVLGQPPSSVNDVTAESMKSPFSQRPALSQSTASEDAVLTMSAMESKAIRRAS